MIILLNWFTSSLCQIWKKSVICLSLKVLFKPFLSYDRGTDQRVQLALLKSDQNCRKLCHKSPNFRGLSLWCCWFFALRPFIYCFWCFNTHKLEYYSFLLKNLKDIITYIQSILELDSLFFVLQYMFCFHLSYLHTRVLHYWD